MALDFSRGFFDFSPLFFIRRGSNSNTRHLPRSIERPNTRQPSKIHDVNFGRSEIILAAIRPKTTL